MLETIIKRKNGEAIAERIRFFAWADNRFCNRKVTG